MENITLETNRVARINPSWLEKKRSQLESLKGGESNENYAELALEIANAEEQDRKAQEFDERAAKLGYIPNRYAGRCCRLDRPVGVGEGYAVKAASGKWYTVCVKWVFDALEKKGM